MVINGEPFKVRNKIEYKPYDYAMAKSKFSKLKGRTDEMWEQALNELREYNETYFSKLIWDKKHGTQEI